MKRLLCLLGMVLCSFSVSAFGQETDERINMLEKAVTEQQKTIEMLKEEVARQKGGAVEAMEPAQPQAAAAPVGRRDPWPRGTAAGRVRLIDLSMDALIAVGGSTEDDDSLQTLQGGGHDPRKRGFTVQNIELSLLGAVDPYLSGESHIIFFLDPLSGETEVELEEVFLTTQGLPFGLQLEAGHFFTEFGRINAKHPHQWHWQDQPIINTRLFGPDGMRGPGFRLGWLTPLPWFAEMHLGAQNAGGETMTSFLATEEVFEERPLDEGRPFVEREVRNVKDLVYLARVDNFWDLSEELAAKFGLSALYGPNSTGPRAETFIYGADLMLKWRPESNERGWPLLIWESEIMKRKYRAAGATVFDEADPAVVVADFPSAKLRDWGLYTQLLYGFSPGWTAGVRYEYAGGSGDSVQPRDQNPFRDDRYRISPLVAWHPSEFSRLRLQYNYDRADHLESGKAHSVWLGVEFMYGAHPAHTY